MHETQSLNFPSELMEEAESCVMSAGSPVEAAFEVSCNLVDLKGGTAWLFSLHGLKPMQNLQKTHLFVFVFFPLFGLR